jgi:hypothetical protein
MTTVKRRERALGNTVPYFIARIARDRPDIMARMKAGEFKSVRAAALAAGIVEPSFQCPCDVEKAAQRLAKHFAGDRLAALIAALQRRIGELSRAMEKSNPGSKKKGLSSIVEPKSEVLAKAGIPKTVASNCEAIAAIPEKDFEAERP